MFVHQLTHRIVLLAALCIASPSAQVKAADTQPAQVPSSPPAEIPTAPSPTFDEGADRLIDPGAPPTAANTSESSATPVTDDESIVSIESETEAEPNPESSTLSDSEPAFLGSPSDYVLNEGFAGLGGLNSAYGVAAPVFSPFSVGKPTSVTLGPLNFGASISGGLVSEKRGGSTSDGADGDWRMGTQISTSIQGTLGRPRTGRFMEFDHAASLQTGGSSNSEGAVNQALSLIAHYDFAKLKLSLAGNYSFLTGTERDIGSEVDRTSGSLSLIASYPLSVKTGLGATVTAERSEYSQGVNSDRLVGTLFIDRQITLKMRLGLGVTAGTVREDNGVEGIDVLIIQSNEDGFSISSGRLEPLSEDQTFEQLNLRLSYRPTSKLSMNGTIGYEFRQTELEDTATPIFSASLGYAVRANTRLSLSASRAVSNSARVGSTNFTSNTITASASQKLGLRASLALSAGYQNATYEDATSDESQSREDNYFFIRPNLSWRLAKRLSLSVYYSYTNNQSNEQPFATQQAGVHGTLHF